MVACLVRDQEAVGSNPATPTNYRKSYLSMKTLINKAFFLFSASLIRLILPQITSKNASQNASMQVKMQVKISHINAKNPRTIVIARGIFMN